MLSGLIYLMSNYGMTLGGVESISWAEILSYRLLKRISLMPWFR